MLARATLVFLSLTVLPVLTGACAAKRGDEGAAYPETPAPRTVAEAEAQIASAREAMGLPPVPASGPQSGAAGGAWPKAAPEPAQVRLGDVSASTPASDAARRAESRAEITATTTSKETACARMCRALASMRRASDALCRLAGATDPRCLDGRRTLAESEQRVAGCGC